jgi:hypothetical protein
MRAQLVHESEVTRLVAEGDEVLAKQSHRPGCFAGD